MSDNSTDIFSMYNNLNETNINELNMHRKSDDNVILLYNDHNKKNTLRNCFLDAKTYKPITSQMKNLLYNNDALEFLNNKTPRNEPSGEIDWRKTERSEGLTNFSVYNFYEGTVILVFNHNDKWYITTRKCLDAFTSFWDHTKSHGTLFTELFPHVESLDKNLCYHFLLCSDNDLLLLRVTTKFITNDTKQNKSTNESTNESNDSNESTNESTNGSSNDTCQKTHTLCDFQDIDLNNIDINVKKNEPLQFENLNDVLKSLNDTPQNKNSSGFVIYCDGEICKLQKNNNVNVLQLQDYMLGRRIPYNVYVRLRNVFSTLANELLFIYMSTRKKNDEMYKLLPSVIKFHTYKLHGIFLKNKIPLKIIDVSNYLYSLNVYQIINLLKCKSGYRPKCYATHMQLQLI